MDRKSVWITGLVVLSCCAITSAPAGAQIVSGAGGTIDLRLNPYWDHIPGTNDPTSSQIVSIPIGLENVSASIDGTGYYSAQGLSLVDYQYTQVGPGGARFDFDALADTESDEEGGGGSAGVQLDVTFPAAVHFRFEADAINSPIYYEVSFNGVSAYAEYDAYFGGRYGTFPLKYIYEDGYPVFAYGWETYVHEGILPAGTYHLTTEVLSAIHGRYGVGLSSRGSASLHVQLLGDADLDGFVGIDDLNAVLASWNRSSASGQAAGAGDVDGDGFVGIADLNEVLGNWNADVRSIPEPTGAVIAMLFALSMIGRTTARRMTGQP